MTGAPGKSPQALRAGIVALRQAATDRYGDGLISVEFDDAGLRGTVALTSQAAELQRMVAELWPGARCQLLVLATRRSRVALYPEAEPLDIWRRRPDDDAIPELTTQLLPGDPPAGLLAFRGEQFLVRAPGQAIGWVARTARFRFGVAQAIDPPGVAVVPPAGWEPKVVRASALALLGRPYVFGGTGGVGIDCSGLSWRAFLTAGVRLPRNSRAQRKVGERVRLADLGEADLICAVHRGPKRTSHLALYLGEDEVIHACSECHEVHRERLADFQARYQVLTVRRVPGAVGPSR